jgi:flagellar biosynthesis GTPase FlhF
VPAKEHIIPKNREEATTEARIRIETLERDVREIRLVADEAHRVAAAQHEHMKGMTEWQQRQNGDSATLSQAVNKMISTLSEKMDVINKQITAMNLGHQKDIANICTQYDKKLEVVTVTAVQQQVKFQRWLIGLMGTVIGGLMITIISIRIGF